MWNIINIKVKHLQNRTKPLQQLGESVYILQLTASRQLVPLL
jgi:hypothetical protein